MSLNIKIGIVVAIIVILLAVLIAFGVKLWRNRIVKNKIYYDKEKKNLKRIYFTKRGIMCGEDIFYYPTGETNKVQNWVNGKKEGPFVVYHKNGKKYIVGNYQDGMYSGNCSVYDKDGKLFNEYKYEAGKL